MIIVTISEYLPWASPLRWESTHFIDEETEVQRGDVTFSLFHQQAVKAELGARPTGLPPRLLWRISGRPKWPEQALPALSPDG